MAVIFKPKRSGGIVPPRILIHGQEGTGKSTFGAGAPNPIFIQTEDGLSGISVDTLGVAKTHGELYGMIDWVRTAKHDYQTVVIDSADWAADLLLQKIAEDNKLTTFDRNAKALAYGRANEAIEKEWYNFTSKLDEVRNERNMAVIVIAHTESKREESPITASYDKLQPRLDKHARAVLTEWADLTGLAAKKVIVRETDTGFGSSTGRATDKSGNMTFLFVNNNPAYTAKTRWAMPDEMPLHYATFHQHLMAAMQAAANAGQSYAQGAPQGVPAERITNGQEAFQQPAQNQQQPQLN